MIHVEQKLNEIPEFNTELFAPKERIVFLDIETTGLKASRSSLYLIGLAVVEDDVWVLHQFFAESLADEPVLLNALGTFLKERKRGQDHLILVTYNGDRFDLPYLKEVEREYNSTGLFRDTVSFDLYKAIKPYKCLMGLCDLKLKTVEKMCGIDREDPYTGGELIYVYEEYLRLSNIIKGGCEDNSLNEGLKNKCLQCLLLHNAEDIADMIPTMESLGYQYLFDGKFKLEKAEVINLAGNRKKILNLRFRLCQKLPKELYREDEYYVVSVSGTDPTLMEITVVLVEEELRLYYSDYKNYYYLPAEDMAIHKSVGEFVERKNRIQATAQSCYTREEGTYFAVPDNAGRLAPFFYKAWKGMPYSRFTQDILSDEGKLKEFALAVLERYI